ncbi:hypothetical protein [Micromonospora zingiberis]|uniref:hypothetical protein n=1 Tax=Micromonospora zingiberis TaxID=2053011 RepID=UPI00103CC0BE|nr:hypothetical protein [Micromonospora zingiberis]
MGRVKLLLSTRLGWSLLIGVSVPYVLAQRYLPAPWATWISLGILFVGILISMVAINAKFESGRYQGVDSPESDGDRSR